MTGPDAELLARVRGRLAADGADPTPATVALALRTEGALRGDSQLLSVLAGLQSELAGAGPLEPLLRNPQVTDVLVNGPEDVWVDAGAGLVRAGVRFPDEAAVRRLAQRLTSSIGRRLDDAQPFADARLPGGIRLHAVLPPVCPSGTCLSFRVPRRTAFGLDELTTAGSLVPPMSALLEALVTARLAFLVSGGTGTGKTTLLSTLLGLAEPAERIVLVEDSGELRPDRPHVVRLESRPPNLEGAGAITLRDLVRQALRMRPDRLVVGEVRGAEVVDLLAALNTGHEGGCGTVHANSAQDVPARLEALALAAGLGRDALHSQLAAGVHALIHLTRDPSGVRRVTEVRVLVRGTEGLVTAQPALAMIGGEPRRGPGAERLVELLRSRGRGWPAG